MAEMNSRFADKLSIKKSTNYLIDNQSTALCPFSLFVLMLEFSLQSPQHKTSFVNKSVSLLSLLLCSLQEPTQAKKISGLKYTRIKEQSFIAETGFRDLSCLQKEVDSGALKYTPLNC